MFLKASEQLGVASLKHLLVDLDGTLLGNQGIPLSVDFIRQSIAQLKPYGGVRKAAKVLWAIQKEFTHPSSKSLTNDNRVVELFAKQMNLSLEEARQILREGVLKIFPGLKRHFYPIEGAREFLEWVKDGIHSHWRPTQFGRPKSSSFVSNGQELIQKSLDP